MQLSTSTNLFSKRIDGRTHTPYIESIQRCYNAGFRTLDFSCVELFSTYTELNGDDWEKQLEKIDAFAESLQIQFTQGHVPYSPGYMPSFKNDEQRQAFFKMALRSIDIARCLKIPWMVVHPFTRCDDVEYSDAASVEYNQKFYAPILEHAVKLGVGIAFENMIEYPIRRKFSARAEELCMLVDSFHAPEVGACWDFGHGNRLYKDQYYALSTLGSRVVALHVNDNDGNNDLHQLPFMGNVNWNRALTALKKIGYTGDFTYEVYGLTKNMPENMKDFAATYAHTVGNQCLSLYNSLQV